MCWKQKGLVFGFLSLLCLGAFNTPRVNVSAAACNDSGAYGNVTMNVSIPVSGEYVVWARILVAAPSATALLLEVGGNTCYSVGNASLPANTWTWINYQGSTTSNTMKYTFNNVGTQSVKLIGQSADVRVDKVLFMGTGEQCASNGSVPSGDGANCNTAPVTETNQPASPTAVTPSIVTAQPDNVAKVEYYIGDELVYSTDKAEALDTSLLKNGDYELTTKVTYKDGTTAEETQLLTVNNPPQSLGTVRRWARKNKELVVAGVGTVSVGGLGGMVYFGRNMLRHRRLYLIHHGMAR